MAAAGSPHPVRWPVATCMALGVLAATISGCDPGSSASPQSSTCAIPTAAPTGIDAPADQAPGGGGLQIVDHGYTQVGGTSHTAAGTVSLGAIVRNTSARIAYRTRVTLRILDPQGHNAVAPLNATQLILEVPVILPHQQVNIGSWAALRIDLSLAGLPDIVTRFDIELGPPRWLPAGDERLFPTYTTTFRSLDRASPQPQSGSMVFTLSSTSCRTLVTRGVGVVFFNPTGAVIGGTFDPTTSEPRCESGTHDEYIIANQSIPNGIDNSKTQMTPYCDLAPVGRDHRPSAPVN